MIRLFFWLSLLPGLMVTTPLMAQHPPGFTELTIGDRAPDFTLPGIDGRDWSLSDFADEKILMVYFTSNHCPVCHAHDPRLVQLLARLKGKSIAVVAINPNSGDGLRPDELGYSKYDDSFEDMTPYAKDEGFTFPYLYDGETQSVAKKYGCLATPHVFLFDQDRKLQYKGRFDDSRFPDPATVTKQDTRDALLAMLSGQSVPTPVTKPFGCSTKWREKITRVEQDEKDWASAEVTLDNIDAAGVAKLAKNDSNKYRLFNVWSTTCAPCVKEFPGLTKVARRMGLRNFELITISTDLPKDRSAVVDFLSRHRAVTPKKIAKSLESEGRKSNNYLYTDASMERLIDALDPKWEGPQPHSVLVAPGGKIVFRHNGPIEADELLDALLKEMSTGYQPNPK